MRMKFEEEGTEMLPEKNLVYERGHPLGQGVQRLYRFGNGYGLTVSQSDLLHPKRDVWQILVVKNISKHGDKFTPAAEGEVPFQSERFIKAGDRNKKIVEAIDEFDQWCSVQLSKSARLNPKPKTGPGANPIPVKKEVKPEPKQIDLEEAIEEKKKSETSSSRKADATGRSK